MILDLPSPFAVVCHDAGAASHILEWVAAERPSCRTFLSGPARDLWQRRLPGVVPAATLDAALDGARAVLTGTGWSSDLEHAARARARELGLHSVAVVDHWVNYPMRFERQGTRVLPDEIWVTDRCAAAIARQCFHGLRVVEKPNLYLEAQLAGIGPVAQASDDVLFVLEPARDDWGRGEPGEFQALDYFLSRRADLGLPAGATVRLRPHPSDPPGKYHAWVERHSVERVCMDRSASLAEAISGCRWVAGLHSAAMVVALAAGRRVVCALPPWGPPIALPQPEIVQLRRIAGHT